MKWLLTIAMFDVVGSTMFLWNGDIKNATAMAILGLGMAVASAVVCADDIVATVSTRKQRPGSEVAWERKTSKN